MHAQNQALSIQQKDEIYLSNAWQNFWKRFELNPTQLEVSLQYSVEKMNTENYRSPYIYNSKYDEAFPIGFKIGTSWEIYYKKKNTWRVMANVNYLSSAIKQSSPIHLSPLIGNFYAYPFKNPTWYVGFQMLHKKTLYSNLSYPISIHWVLGPGIDIQISPQNIDQQQYKKANYYFLSAHTGLELSNKKKQSIGLYYQMGRNGFNNKIETRLSSWQFGLIIPLQQKI